MEDKDFDYGMAAGITTLILLGLCNIIVFIYG